MSVDFVPHQILLGICAFVESEDVHQQRRRRIMEKVLPVVWPNPKIDNKNTPKAMATMLSMFIAAEISDTDRELIDRLKSVSDLLIFVGVR